MIAQGSASDDRLAGAPADGCVAGDWRPQARIGWRDADIFVLVALLLLTATFGRVFSKVGWDDASLFVTEPALIATIALVFVRLGPGRAWRELRARVPLIPLIVFWIVGAIAASRGLAAFGISQTTDDIGLVEYSIALPLVALVASDRWRLNVLQLALVFGGVSALVVFTTNDFVIRAGADLIIQLQNPASGLYISFVLAWVAARRAHGLHTPWFQLVAGGAALIMIVLTDHRSVWLAAIVVLGAIAVLAPRSRRKRSAMYAAVAIVAAAIIALSIDTVWNPPSGGDVGNEVVGLAEPETGEGSNVRWRLAYWRELVSRTPEGPALGVGFGQPSEFLWRGRQYDFRSDTGTFDVSGPHNVYVHVLYRMGVVGLAAMLALIGLVLWRTLPLLAQNRLPPSRRSELVAILAMFASAATIAFFNDALVNPFLGLFFWTLLGLLCAWTALEVAKSGQKHPRT